MSTHLRHEQLLRILTIWQLLQLGRQTLTSLALATKVHRRTVRRDIECLRLAGFTITKYRYGTDIETPSTLETVYRAGGSYRARACPFCGPTCATPSTTHRERRV